MYHLGEMGRWWEAAFLTRLFLKPQALGCGCVAQTVLSRGALGGALMISVGFAMAVTLAIYVAGGISGKPAFATHRFRKRRGGRLPHSCSWSFSPLLRRSALPSSEGPEGSKGWGASTSPRTEEQPSDVLVSGWAKQVWHTKDKAASEGIS